MSHLATPHKILRHHISPLSLAVHVPLSNIQEIMQCIDSLENCKEEFISKICDYNLRNSQKAIQAAVTRKSANASLQMALPPPDNGQITLI
jgi:hypothetical protein